MVRTLNKSSLGATPAATSMAKLAATPLGIYTGNLRARKLRTKPGGAAPASRLQLGNYIFIFYFFSAFFIVSLWSTVTKFSTIFFWNGDKFVLRQDIFKNYNIFSQNGGIYECGFSGVEEPLKKIEIQYLVIAIYFIVYEIELLLFLPIFLNIEAINFFSGGVVMLAFAAVAFSYWYEWEFYLLHFSY
jgi:NADH:ubiquinone oxidoreductase subunit 3 (subunit A)